MKTRRTKSLLAILGLITIPCATFAQTPAASGATTTAAANTGATSPRLDPNTVICKAQDATGSRLGAKRICLTRQQWADQAAASRERLNESQLKGRNN